MKHLQEYRELIPWFEDYVRRNVKKLAGMEDALGDEPALSPVDTYNNAAMVTAFMRVCGGNYNIRDTEGYVMTVLAAEPGGSFEKRVRIFVEQVKEDHSGRLVTVEELESYSPKMLEQAFLTACSDILEMGVTPPPCMVPIP